MAQHTLEIRPNVLFQGKRAKKEGVVDAFEETATIT